MATVAVMLPVGWPARRIEELARHAAGAGIGELWVAEDLGLHGGVALGSHLLATVPGVTVGLGIAPAAARHPAFLAMQAATLGQLHPGRFLLGIGHGMPGWMRQLGIWPDAPVARLTATIRAVRALLRGERLTLDAAGVVAEEVGLATAPVTVPLYAGVRGPRSLTAVAPLVDGIVLAGWSGPDYVRSSRTLVEEAAGAPRRIVASARLAFDGRDPDRARRRLASQFRRDAVQGSLQSQLAPTGRAPTDPSLLPDVAIAGGRDAVADGLERWAAAGADVVLLDPITPDDLDELIAAGIPPLSPGPARDGEPQVSDLRAGRSARTSGPPAAGPPG